MSFIGNVLWLLLGGFIIALMYFVAGLVLCVTIIGIPFGVQLFKMSFLSLAPFGKEIANNPMSSGASIILNVLWILFGWWEIALVHLAFAFLCAITIIGLPFAVQHLKLIRMGIMPFGTSAN